MEIEKYVDKLPIPKVVKSVAKNNKITYYEVKMNEIYQKLHRDLPPTKVWAYNRSYPGPTFEVKRRETVKVKWINKLPKKHLLPVDKTIHGAEPPNPEVRTVVHLHGASVSPESDGYPEAWFTKDFKKVGPFFTRKIYSYPNNQRATTLWYHDHALGITRLNVYAGFAGFYLIRDKNERSLNLPRGKYEIPLVIQDRSFNEDGSLFYPSQPDTQTDVELPNPSIVPEFFGDTILVNGKVWPYLEVEPRKYRFRLLNGSNSRFYKLSLPLDKSFIQIGTDGGLLGSPVKVKELIIAPGERADIIIDFKNYSVGTKVILKNSANTPFPDGDPVDPNSTGQIMEFRVVPLVKPDTSKVPKKLSNFKRLNKSFVVRTRNLSLNEGLDEFGRLKLLLDNREWDFPITEKPLLNTIEEWNLINVTPDTHPIHLHLVQFQLLNRQKFDVDYYNMTGEIKYTSQPIPPDPNEKGWKDTIRANPGEITRIIVPFKNFKGLYVWHCHILEHEDHEMMRPYEVVKNKFK